MDLAILIILLAVVVFFFKRFSAFIYFIAVADMFLRILTFIKLNVNVPELYTLINKYIPESIPAIIDRYTNGIIFTIIMWIYVIIYCIFLFYSTRILFKKN